MDRVRQTRRIGLSPAAIGGGLAAVSALFILLAVVGQYLRWQGVEHRFIEMFSVDTEKNPPALFSGLMLLLSAVVLAVVAISESASRWSRHWWILAGGFLVMSLDETFSFHEKLIDPVRDAMGDEYPLVFHFAWVVPALALVVVLGISFAGFLRALPSSTRRLFLTSASLYLGGAIGMEMLGGRYHALHGSDFTQSMIAIAEEALEMFGVCIFLYAALSYFRETGTQVLIEFES